MAIGSEEKVITPQFVLRDSSTGEMIKHSKLGDQYSMDASGNMIRKGEFYTPKFETFLELGTLIEVGTKSQADYFLVAKPESQVIAKDPFAIFVKRVRKPENYDALVNQGKLINPATLTRG